MIACSQADPQPPRVLLCVQQQLWDRCQTPTSSRQCDALVIYKLDMGERDLPDWLLTLERVFLPAGRTRRPHTLDVEPCFT